MTAPITAAAEANGLPEVAPFATWLGLRTDRVEDGRVRASLSPRPELMNRRGVVHGGVLATLLDSVMARAARTLDGVRELGGTTDLHVQFMRPAEGELQVEGWVEHGAITLAYCRAEVRNVRGELVAVGTASMRLRRVSAHAGEFVQA